MADELSRKTNFLVEMQVKVIGFEAFRENYHNDPHFGNLYIPTVAERIATCQVSKGLNYVCLNVH